MIAITEIKVRSLDVDRKEVSWSTVASYEDPLDYTFEVMRSESPEGSYEAISPVFEDRYIFVDSRVPVGDFFVRLWYKIRVTKKNGGATTSYGPVTQEAEPDRVAQYIRRSEMTLLTQAIGRACWLFKVRNFGARCTSCWDPKLNAKIREKCMSCFDTGFIRGYHNPIEIWVQIDPSPKSTTLAAQQQVQYVLTAARTSFYPNINPGDVLVEAENKRWRVQTVETTERLRAPIHQELKMKQIEQTDIEYRLPINLAVALRDIQPSPSRMFENPTTLETALAKRTPDIWAAYEAEK